jgi:hypothetical protein
LRVYLSMESRFQTGFDPSRKSRLMEDLLKFLVECPIVAPLLTKSWQAEESEANGQQSAKATNRAV